MLRREGESKHWPGPSSLISSNVLCASWQNRRTLFPGARRALGNAGPDISFRTLSWSLAQAGCSHLFIFLFHPPVLRVHNLDGLKLTKVLCSYSSGGRMSVTKVSAGPHSLCRHRGRVCPLPLLAAGIPWCSTACSSISAISASIFTQPSP